jgi:hypothetical protein
MYDTLVWCFWGIERLITSLTPFVPCSAADCPPSPYVPWQRLWQRVESEEMGVSIYHLSESCSNLSRAQLAAITTAVQLLLTLMLLLPLPVYLQP